MARRISGIQSAITKRCATPSRVARCTIFQAGTFSAAFTQMIDPRKIIFGMIGGNATTVVSATAAAKTNHVMRP